MTDAHSEVWRPGSFTKNFSWGPPKNGLLELHRIIKLGFDGVVEDVPREIFRKRAATAGRPDFIPLNFFLFNRSIDGRDYIIADELVFQAINGEHSQRFDKLALFVFNLSLVGRWAGSDDTQRRPALWANAYIKERVARDFLWDTKSVSADDIQRFIVSNPGYQGKTSRKLATNLNYLYSIGGLSDVPSKNIERWWVDALFLALDRITEDRVLESGSNSQLDYIQSLSKYDFLLLTGHSTIDKQLATKHLVSLYIACGGRLRFSEENVRERTRILVRDLQRFANDPRARGAIHPTNPRILKSIPYACAMLARYAGFDVLDPDELEAFDLEDFVKKGTRRAIEELRGRNIFPTMSAEDLIRITRGK